MTDRVILTEQREKLLNGEYEGSDAALRKQKWRLRESANTALHELVKIAESPHIDTREVIDPDDLLLLVGAIMEPDGYGFTVNAPPEEVSDEYLAHQHQIYLRLQHLLENYRERTIEATSD